MPERRFPEDPAGVGPRDEVDDRIRALLGRAVASAPPPPSPAEVRAPGLPAVSVVLALSGGSDGDAGGRHHRPPRASTARMVGAVAASIAVVVLAVVGARTIGGSGDRTAMPGDGLPVRYVPTEVPRGLVLTDIEVSGEPVPEPTPEVAVYEGPDDVLVRIAEGPTDWAARTAGPTLNDPSPATTMPTTPPGTGAPLTTEGPATTGPGTTVPPTSSPTSPPTSSPAGVGSPDTTGGSTTTVPGGSEGTAPTTTIPLDVASLPSVPGVPGRPDIQATTVRGAVGGLEAHDDTTTTVWFQDRGQLVAVDVFGLDHVGALGIVDRLAIGVDGSLGPAPEDGLERVAASPARPAGSASPALVRLVYTAPDRAALGGGPAFVVTTSRLAPGTEDLLAAAAGSFGRIERWGDRQVLVDDGLDGEATTRVAFVDPAGVLVTVLGPTGDLRPYVDGLVPADQGLWDRTVADLDSSSDTTSDPGSDVETGSVTTEPSPTTTALLGPGATAEPPPTGG